MNHDIAVHVVVDEAYEMFAGVRNALPPAMPRNTGRRRQRAIRAQRYVDRCEKLGAYGQGRRVQELIQLGEDLGCLSWRAGGWARQAPGKKRVDYTQWRIEQRRRAQLAAGIHWMSPGFIGLGYTSMRRAGKSNFLPHLINNKVSAHAWYASEDDIRRSPVAAAVFGIGRGLVVDENTETVRAEIVAVNDSTDDAKTADERLIELVRTYVADRFSTPADWNVEEGKRYALVEQSTYDKGYLLSTFDDMDAAAKANTLGEYAEDWNVVKLVDLHTGVEYRADRAFADEAFTIEWQEAA